MVDGIIAMQMGLVAGILKRLHADDLTSDEKRCLDDMVAQIPTREDYTLVEQLAEIIRMLVGFPKGINMLLGRIPPPTLEEINEMILAFRSAGPDLGTRVDGGENIPTAERLIYTADTFTAVLEACGGWKHISVVANGWIKLSPNAWAIVLDHVRLVRTKVTRIDGSSVKKIADAHGCATDTIHNVVNVFPKELAAAILSSPIGDSFELKAVDEYPAI